MEKRLILNALLSQYHEIDNADMDINRTAGNLFILFALVQGSSLNNMTGARRQASHVTLFYLPAFPPPPF